jgi:hypothetical protein
VAASTEATLWLEDSKTGKRYAFELATFPLKIQKWLRPHWPCRERLRLRTFEGERRSWLRKNLLRIGVREGSEGEWYIRLRENSARACLLCQVGTDMDDVVGDHADGQR